MQPDARSAARDPHKAFCKGGTQTCEVCVGSCGIEEYQEAESAATPSLRERATRAMNDVAALAWTNTDEAESERIEDLVTGALHDLLAENERLRDALKFYGVVKDVNAVSILLRDCGEHARKALGNVE